MPPAPSPLHVLRNHSAHIAAVNFSYDNERLISGDLNGTVTVLSTRSLRPITTWKAHTDAILSVKEWNSSIITHGRDNKLHFWKLPSAVRSVTDTATPSALPTPELIKSMDVNALNFCGFSFLATLSGALIALPNLVDSEKADIWEIDTCTRLHGGIGNLEFEEVDDSRPRGSTGIIMSLHLFQHDKLRLFVAYESGQVIMWENTSNGMPTLRGEGWTPLSTWKLHVESVMGMAVSSDNSFALTVSADHLIGYYPLNADEGAGDARSHSTKHPGNAAVCIRPDGRVCAVGGWDGKIRLYSTKSFKSLGQLSYHREQCSCLTFAQAVLDPSSDESGDEDLPLTAEEIVDRSHWLAAGSKDSRISVWALRSIGSMSVN